jgi:hypothetical protein
MKKSIKKKFKKYIKNQIKNAYLIKKINSVLFPDNMKVGSKSDKNMAKIRPISDSLDGLEMPYFDGLEGSRFFLSGIEKKSGSYSKENVINIVEKIGVKKFDLSGIIKITDKIEIFKNYIKENAKDKILTKSYPELQTELNITKSQAETLIKKCLELGLLEKISRSNYKIKFKD